MNTIEMSETGETAVRDYAAQAREFLAHSREYLAADRLHQASEKGWGAAAHMAKAVALAQGWEYTTHAEFSVVLNQACQQLDDERLRLLRGIPNVLHSNYYRRKRHLDAESIGHDLDSVAEIIDRLEPLTAP